MALAVLILTLALSVRGTLVYRHWPARQPGQRVQAVVNSGPTGSTSDAMRNNEPPETTPKTGAVASGTIVGAMPQPPGERKSSANPTHPGVAKAVTAQSKAAAADSSAGKTFGSKTAPITMEVFSDFQCPSCRALYEDTLKQLMNDYVAAGKVYLIHRDFPLPIPAHKYAREAARYANAAARIGKYAEVEAALYDNQSAWSADGSLEKYVAAALTPAEMKKVKKLMEGCTGDAAGVTPAKTNGQQAAHGCQLDAAIDKDIELGQQIPVQATPTFVIRHGDQHTTSSGVVTYPVLKQYLDYLMSQ